MRLAYVDTSCLVAVAFDEPGARQAARRLERVDRLFSSNLLEAELRSALLREGVDGDGRDLTAGITWVFPNRPLTREIERVTDLGYVRGAHLWHLACAVFLADDPGEIAFVTLDRRQGEVAAKLGFASAS